MNLVAADVRRLAFQMSSAERGIEPEPPHVGCYGSGVPMRVFSFRGILSPMGKSQIINRKSSIVSYFTVLTSGASPWMRTSRRSPDSIGPTPLGVPVRITSPGSNVMFVEIKLTRW